jgi:hypothetical protein
MKVLCTCQALILNRTSSNWPPLSTLTSAMRLWKVLLVQTRKAQLLARAFPW